MIAGETAALFAIMQIGDLGRLAISLAVVINSVSLLFIGLGRWVMLRAPGRSSRCW